MKYSRVSVNESSSDEREEQEPPSIIEEVICQTKMAWPVVVNMVSYRAPWVISIAFVGRLGEVELASAAMASTLANVSGLSIVMGLSNAQSTLSSQAFGGGDYERVGVALQRSIIVFGSACLLISLLWAFGIEPFLKFTGQDPVVSENSAQYLRFLIPGLFGNALCVALQRFLQAQGITKPPAAAAFFTALLHAPLNWCLIYGFNLGYFGAAYATSINQCLTPLILLAISYGYCGQSFAAWLLPDDVKQSFQTEIELRASLSRRVARNNNSRVETPSLPLKHGTSHANQQLTTTELAHQLHSDSSSGPCVSLLPVYGQCWNGWSTESLEVSPMYLFMKLAFAGLIMVLEWWASEIAILMAGAVDGSIGLSTMSLYQTTNSLCYMFCKGYEVATTTRVGSNLGAGQPQSSIIAAKVGPSLAGLQAAVLGSILWVGKHTIPLLFTGTSVDGRALAERVGATYGYLAVYVVGDAMSAAFGGAITGCGRQRYAAAVVIFSYGLIGLPLCWHASHALDMGYLGIVAGMTVGTLVQCCGNMLVVVFTDFEQESKLAQERIAQNASSSKQGRGTQLVSNPLFVIVEDDENELPLSSSENNHSESNNVIVNDCDYLNPFCDDYEEDDDRSNLI